MSFGGVKSDPHVVLNETFGYDSFRDRQLDIIQTVLSGKDAMVLMPTGGGKSLCFQIPALCMEGTAIVVSPLIALMKDQVDALRQNGVPAAFINSSIDSREIDQIMTDARMGRIKMLYLAPERISDQFWRYLSNLNISLFAIDEAHCMSHWGHDFRPDYRALAVIKDKFKDIPVIALTATADKYTREDILEVLNIPNAEVFISSFNRPNIKYLVEPKRRSSDKLLTFLKTRKDKESGIIYCLSRKSTESLADLLNLNGYKALPYHAGLSADQRDSHQMLFQKDEVNIIVATIAFGMGIDKSNVRFVVHMDLPKNIESYYQETGRAGRDGESSVALLFYTYADVLKLKQFVEIENNEEQSHLMLKKLDQMAAYGSSNSCRRQYLLNYFDEDAPAKCGNCDICLSSYEEKDVTTDAQILLSAVVRLKESFGMNYVIDVVTGSRSKKIRDAHTRIPTYGKGDHHPKKYWLKLCRYLLDDGYVDMTSGKFPILTVNGKSWAVLKGEQPVIISMRKTKEIEVRQESTDDSVKYPDLFKALKKVRTEIAVNKGLPSYIILSDASLRDLVNKMPRDYTQLQSVSGFGAYKVEQYGDFFLKVINEFIEENSIDPDKEKTATIVKPPKPRYVEKLTPTLLETYEMFVKNPDIGFIAETRGMSPATIENHITQLIYHQKIDIHELIDTSLILEIEEAINRTDTIWLKPIKEALPEHVTYAKIRWTMAAYEANNPK